MTEPCAVKKPPYYWVDKWGNGYWTPKKHMREAGFENVACGEDGTAARLTAQGWYNRWVEHKLRGGISEKVEVWPAGSIGEAWVRFRRTGEWKRKKARTREDWDRGWKYIKPVFAMLKPAEVTLEELSVWYSGDEELDIKGMLELHGVREAHRAVKIWRAFWQIMAAMKYCSGAEDPSFGIRRKTPRGRSERWDFDEVRRLVKRAIRMRRYGLACIMAICWDSQFSPVDARTLRARHRKIIDGRLIFDRSEGRTKAEEGEEKAVIGTLSRRTERLIAWYIRNHFGDAELHPDTILFVSGGHEPISRPGEAGQRGGDRGGGRPREQVRYTKDLLSKDFRKVRTAEFGPLETRKLMDNRRSGAVEALAGQADPGAMAAKMGNTIDENRELQKTYLPAQTAIVRLVDEARVIGRKRLRRVKE